MAGEDRPASDAIARGHEVETRPHEFDFYQVLRRLECSHREYPRLGYAARPSEEPVRLGQEPHLFFAPSTIASYRTTAPPAPARMSVYFFGAFGPHGPLPLHLTEYARQRIHNYGDRTLGRFLDMFHHRMLLLFYRAWADSEPAVSRDRPDADHVARYVLSLIGRGIDPLRDRDAMPDCAKLYFAGHLAAPGRHPEGLRSMIEICLGVPAQIEELVETWSTFPEEARWRLGTSSETGVLGRTSVIGHRCRQLQQTFRVVIGPLESEQYHDMLPGQPGLELLRAVVRNYVGDELDWELTLLPKSLDPITLGGSARLGWTARLAGSPGRSGSHRVSIDPTLESPGVS